MFVAHRSIERRVMARLAAVGADDITLAQSRVVQRLAPEPMRLTDLAEQAGVTKQTAGGIVDQLEAAGYLVRFPDPSDRRARSRPSNRSGAITWVPTTSRLWRSR